MAGTDRQKLRDKAPNSGNAARRRRPESIWAQIDRLVQGHAASVRRTSKALAARGWQGPEIDSAGVWWAALGPERPDDEAPLRVSGRTSAELLRRVDEQRRLLKLAGLA